MRAVSGLLAGLMLAAAAGVVAQSTVSGFPSRPRFQAVTVTGAASGVTSSVGLSSTLPRLSLNETDAAADNRWWEVAASGEGLFFSAYNDTHAAGVDFISVQRTANTIDSINLQATSVQVNGVPIGTGAIGASLAAFKAGNEGRANTASASCDSALTISGGLVATGSYALEAFIVWQGGGSTTNGIRGLFAATTGTVWDTQFVATANTSTANVAPAANNLSGGGDFEQLPPAAGAVHTIHAIGSVTGSALTSICWSWAQQTSSATATTVRSGSWIRATRIS
jgi:hypothetical protein